MAWVTIRSRRDPGFWAPFLAAILLSTLLGVGAQLALGRFLRGLDAMARSDPRGAADAAERLLRIWSQGLAVFLIAVAALLVRCVQLGLVQDRMPPAGWWSLGAYRAATGPTARRLGYAGFALALFLALGGVGLHLATERLIAAFAAAHATH